MNSNLFREIATDAIRYWEPRRLLYNLILALVVIWYFIGALPASKNLITFGSFQGLFLLAVLANIFYCAAYIADIFIQLSGFRETWPRLRWILLLIGILFASIITRGISKGIFYPG